MISPLAYIHPEAKIGENVEIGPFVFIDKNVVIGDNNTIMPNVNILYGSRIGNNNRIFPGAVIGAIPQDLKFRGEETTAEIGDNNTIRENVTINRGTAAKGKTIVGNNNLLMEGVHVAHDTIVGSGCIIGNSTKMAGEVIIDDNAIVSANVLMHQFCRVGGYVMIQGGCRFSKDIPPYIIAGREPIAYSGINIIGLRRRGFSNELIENIHNTYRIIYNSGKNVSDALQQIREESLDLFSHGIVDLKTRAQIERMYWSVTREISQIASSLRHVPDEFRNLDKLLADKYFCNFSLFQSLPDLWAIDQVFPIMPIQRLDERPDRNATLQDITCDSDGKIANFVTNRIITHDLPVHTIKAKEHYYIGVFLVGAYQEILGDLHNLFGDTNAVHVSVDGKGYTIDQILDGETVAEVLDYVQYNPKKLVLTLETWVTKSVK